MVVMRFGVFVSAMCATVSCEAPSGAGQASEASGLPRATISVASVERFCPSAWEMVVSGWAEGDIILTGTPELQCQRLEGQVWVPTHIPPGKRRPEDGPRVGRGVHERVETRIGKGRVARFRWEFADWRVVGFDGHYRARALWSLLGDRRVRMTDWTLFQVASPGEAGALLSEACDEDNELWASYQAFMNTGLAVVAPRLGGGSEGLAEFVGGVGAKLGATWERLTVAAVLPEGLRRRMSYAKLLGEAQVAVAQADEHQRRQRLAEVASYMEAFGGTADLYGCLAKWQSVALRQGHMSPQMRTQAAQELAGEAAWMAVGRAYPVLVKSCGVVDPAAAGQD